MNNKMLLSVILLLGLLLIHQAFASNVIVTISNGQPVTITGNFQQMVAFDPTNTIFSSLVSGDLGNIRFYNGSQELYSWCESGCSSSDTNAIFWVLLPQGVSASSTFNINMTFSGSDYDGIYGGIAPQLTGTYAQYDNGASVFPFLYQNFAGVSCPSGWNCQNSYGINNGAYITFAGTLSWVLTTGTNYGLNASQLLDSYGTVSSAGAGLNALEGYINDPNGGCGEMGFTSIGGGNYGDAQQGNGCAGNSFGSLTTPLNTFSVMSTYWGSPSSVTYQFNYGSGETLSTGTASSSGQIGIWTWRNFGSSSNEIWVRLRTYPPNGVMPSVSFTGSSSFAVGNPTPSTQNIHVGNIGNVISSGGIGGTSPYFYQWLAEPPSGGGFSASYANSICVNAQLRYCTFITNSLTSLGTYQFELSAHDSASGTTTSLSANVVVQPPLLSVGISPSTNTIYIGNFSKFSSTVSGGVPPYTYEWQFTNTSLGAYYDTAVCGSNLVTCNPATASTKATGYGYYNYCLFGTFNAPSCYFSTYGAMSGSNINFSHSMFKANNYSQLPNTSFTLANGNYKIKVIVSDSAGNVSNAIANVVVSTKGNIGIPTVSVGTCTINGCTYSYENPTKYINFTVVNNGNTPYVPQSPIFILVNRCLLIASGGSNCPQNVNASPSNYNNTAWVYQGNVIPSYFEGSCGRGCPNYQNGADQNAGIYDIFWVRPNVTIGINKSITVQMVVGSYTSNYIGFLTSNIIVNSKIAALDGEDPLLVGGSAIYATPPDSSGQAVFTDYYSGMLECALEGSGFTFNGILGSGNLNECFLQGMPFKITNGILTSTAQFNNQEYAIEIQAAASAPFMFGFKTSNTETPAFPQAGLVQSIQNCNTIPQCGTQGYFINGNQVIDYATPRGGTGGCYDGFALLNILSILPYTSTIQEVMQDYGNYTLASGCMSGTSSVSAQVAAYNGVVGTYPIIIMGGNESTTGLPLSLYSVRARYVNPSGSPSVSVGSLQSTVSLNGMIVNITSKTTPLYNKTLQFTENIINSTPNYNNGYTLINRNGGCKSTSAFLNSSCWIYKSNALVLTANTYNIQITTSQMIAYSNSIAQIGNYTLLVSTNKGGIEFTTTYFNFTINTIPPISASFTDGVQTINSIQANQTINTAMSIWNITYEITTTGNVVQLGLSRYVLNNGNFIFIETVTTNSIRTSTYFPAPKLYKFILSSANTGDYLSNQIIFYVNETLTPTTTTTSVPTTTIAAGGCGTCGQSSISTTTIRQSQNGTTSNSTTHLPTTLQNLTVNITTTHPYGILGNSFTQNVILSAYGKNLSLSNTTGSLAIPIWIIIAIAIAGGAYYYYRKKNNLYLYFAVGDIIIVMGFLLIPLA